MSNKNNHITVFEHQTIKLNQIVDGVLFDLAMLKALQSYYGENGVPYFSLIHNGIRFNEYVGAIQVGKTVIEVLPKADNTYKGLEEKNKWRDILIDMLFAVGVFKIYSPSDSSMQLKLNSILDLYFELFVKDVEYLLHTGLVKQYRKKEGNVTALKGSIQFSKHLQKNIIHQERFYVRHTTYDVEHKIHSILYKTTKLLKKINTNAGLRSRIGSLLLYFPEMPDIKVRDATFDKLVFTRKTQNYQKSIEISKLLLLQYHPDISKGKNNVLAIMFDMNKLWEQFIFISLRKHKEKSTTITPHASKYFWKPGVGYRTRMRPDIVVNKDNGDCIVLDTKWKNLNGCNPLPDDLRQMYVYHEYYNAKRVALIYPGKVTSKSSGTYLDPITSQEINRECRVISLSVESKIKEWQKNIYNIINDWMIL